MTPQTMKTHGRYNWKNQPEQLVYIGRNWSGNGFWHQFEKVGEPGVVWCEVLDSDLHMIEETQGTDGMPASSPDMIRRNTPMVAESQPAPTKQPFHINSDRTVAVGEHYWHPMSTCPRGVKVQLLGPHNVAVYSTYDGKDPQWRGWYPVPKIRKEQPQ